MKASVYCSQSESLNSFFITGSEDRDQAFNVWEIISSSRYSRETSRNKKSKKTLSKAILFVVRRYFVSKLIRASETFFKVNNVGESIAQKFLAGGTTFFELTPWVIVHQETTNGCDRTHTSHTAWDKIFKRCRRRCHGFLGSIQSPPGIKAQTIVRRCNGIHA